MSSVRTPLIGKSPHVCLSAAVLASPHTHSCAPASLCCGSEGFLSEGCEGSAIMWEHSRNVKCCKSIKWHFDCPCRNTSCFGASQYHLHGINHVLATLAATLRGWRRRSVDRSLGQTGLPYIMSGLLLSMKFCRGIHDSKMMYSDIFGDPLTFPLEAWSRNWTDCFVALRMNCYIFGELTSCYYYH